MRVMLADCALLCRWPCECTTSNLLCLDPAHRSLPCFSYWSSPMRFSFSSSVCLSSIHRRTQNVHLRLYFLHCRSRTAATTDGIRERNSIISATVTSDVLYCPGQSEDCLLHDVMPDVCLYIYIYTDLSQMAEILWLHYRSQRSRRLAACRILYLNDTSQGHATGCATIRTCKLPYV